jgi:hypothetical protein
VIIRGIDKSKLMEIENFSRNGGQLQFKGKISETARAEDVVCPADAAVSARPVGVY